MTEVNDTAKALQRAKMDSLEEFGDEAIPFYWAGLVILGDGSHPIGLSQRMNRSSRAPKSDLYVNCGRGTRREADSSTISEKTSESELAQARATTDLGSAITTERVRIAH
jgi:hypothetical protein